MPFLYPLYNLSTDEEICVKCTCFIGVNQVWEKGERHVRRTSVSVMLNRQKKKQENKSEKCLVVSGTNYTINLYILTLENLLNRGY